MEKRKMNSLIKDRVIGMFLGIAIGDALGLPVETMTAEQIVKHFERITTYQDVSGNRYFSDSEAGTISDDTQLSIVIAESLIACGEIDPDDLAKRHIQAAQEATAGWGSGTKKSINRLESGVPWRDSGEPDSAGNGVAMKVAPIGAYVNCNRMTMPRYQTLTFGATLYWQINDLTKMTHNSEMAIDSALAQVYAIDTALLGNGSIKIESFRTHFLNRVCGAIMDGMRGEHKLIERFGLMYKTEFFQMNPSDIAALFDGATCYVYNSLPFVYAMFLRSPWSIETLYDTVSAGGDTDSNGSMVGALLGALNGKNIFPKHLIDGLLCRDQIFDLAERFCDRFGIK